QLPVFCGARRLPDVERGVGESSPEYAVDAREHLLFGVSPLTLRLAALLGAALYISAIYSICKLVISDRRFRVVLFICLFYNPLMFDFLVAEGTDLRRGC